MESVFFKLQLKNSNFIIGFSVIDGIWYPLHWNGSCCFPTLKHTWLVFVGLNFSCSHTTSFSISQGMHLSPCTVGIVSVRWSKEVSWRFQRFFSTDMSMLFANVKKHTEIVNLETISRFLFMQSTCQLVTENPQLELVVVVLNGVFLFLGYRVSY